MSLRSETKTLLYQDANITYTVKGDKGKEAILMLHPAFADHQIFQFQTEYFKDRYQVILIDMPGHGANQLKGSKVTLKDMPDLLNQLLSENEIAACHLLGVSLGSLVAQAFLDRYPERTRSLIVVGGYSIHQVSEQIRKEQRKEGLKWLFYILFSMRKFRDHVLSVSCHTKSGRDLFSLGIQQFTRRSFSSMAGLDTLFSIRETVVINHPLLIVIGEFEQPILQEAATALSAMGPEVRSVQIPGAGHCANVDSPHEFNDVIERFLQKEEASIVH